MTSLGSSQRLRIVILGYLVRGPLGGHAWHHLNYVAALRALGHDVWFMEDSEDFPSCYDPVLNETTADPRYGLAFAQAAFDWIGAPECWAFHDAHTDTWHGPAASKRHDIRHSADLVLNLSGANPLATWSDIPVRILLDTDPGFTQARHVTDAAALARAAQHSSFFTFGERVSTGATLPDDGFLWKPTRQPVALDLWPRRPSPPGGRFTTVMVWESYRPIEINGTQLGLKAQSFGPYLGLPRLTNAPLELALGGPSAPRDRLRGLGWSLQDPREPTKTLGTYQQYIAASRGEFTVAKHGYVVTRSGWFSERSANYLATGRPVITQETGFSSILPTGSGLFAFSTPEEALAAIEEVNVNYEHHCAAARDVAEACFSPAFVLESLLSRAYESSPVVR